MLSGMVPGRRAIRIARVPAGGRAGQLVRVPPGAEPGVPPLAPDIGIEWPADAEPVLSGKAAAAPTLEQARQAGLLPVYADCEAYLESLRQAADARNPVPGRLSGRPAFRPLRGGEFSNGALQRRPPFADGRNARFPGPGPGVVTEHAVGGSRRRPGQGRSEER